MTNKDFLIAYNDAGGAFQLLSYLFFIKPKGKIYITKSSYEKIKPFKEISYTLVDDNFKINENFNILTSTSNSNVNTEFDIWERMIASRKKYCVIIDNWCNYEQRFKRKGKIIFPPKILVTDKYALNKCNNLFKGISKIILIDNPFLKYIIYKIEKLNITDISRNILLALPPLKSITKSEWAEVNYFLKDLSILNKIVIRPHPIDLENKKLIDLYILNNLKIKIPIEISQNPIWKDLAEADQIIGINSYILYLAHLLKKNVKIISREDETSEALKNLIIKSNL